MKARVLDHVDISVWLSAFGKRYGLHEAKATVRIEPLTLMARMGKFNRSSGPFVQDMQLRLDGSVEVVTHLTMEERGMLLSLLESIRERTANDLYTEKAAILKRIEKLRNQRKLPLP